MLTALNHEAQLAVKLTKSLIKPIQVNHPELFNSAVDVRKALQAIFRVFLEFLSLSAGVMAVDNLGREVTEEIVDGAKSDTVLMKSTVY
jgi:hypothetical protein